MSGGKDFQEKSERTKAREAFFLEFAKAIRHKFPGLPLMVTGGFRTRRGMEAAVAEGGCDMVGIGRPAVLNPRLPSNIVFNKEVSDNDARLYVDKVKVPWIAKMISPSVGAGAESVSPLCPITILGVHCGLNVVPDANFDSFSGLLLRENTQDSSTVG